MFEVGLILIIFVFAVALLAILTRFGIFNVLGIAVVVVCLVMVGAWSQITARWSVVDELDVSNRPIEVEGDGYVSDQTCRVCHPREYATWHASFHRTMTQVATPQTVVGEFDGVELDLDGRQFRLDRDHNGFWVDMPDPELTGGRIRRQIVLTTGSHNMQAYWIATGRDRTLQQLPFNYLIKDEQRWVPDRSTFLAPPGKRPPDELGLWNRNCIKCHTTHGQSMQVEPERYETRVAEFGISCQACHGPAAQHVRANRDPQRRYRYHLNKDADPTVVHPGRLRARPSSQVCGQCHSIRGYYDDVAVEQWNKQGYRYRPGDELEDTQLVVHHAQDPALLKGLTSGCPTFMEDRFWSDGMVRVSGREYNGLIESPCFKDGEHDRILSCLSCHVMHKSAPAQDARTLKQWANDQLGPGMETNRACTQCHEGFETDEEIIAHTHHKPKSTGSVCYNCHMPHTTWGLLKAIRSHEVDSPSVQATLETGRPNACNLCHLDKTLGWAAGHLGDRYDIAEPQLSGDEQSIAASVLWALTGDAGQRALMAWSMGWRPAQEVSGTSWMGPYLVHLLLDPYDAIRYVAYRSFRGLPGFGSFEYDYLGSGEQRLDAQRQAAVAWSRMHSPAGTQAGEQLLFDPQGRLQEVEFGRLARQRDNRRVDLKE